MSDMPQEVTDAIQKSVREAHQPSVVADRLSGWFESVVSGRESLDDSEAVSRRISVWLSAIEVEVAVKEGVE